MDLEWLPEQLAICRLQPEEPVPAWALAAPFTSITRTDLELSIVVPVDALPPTDARRGLHIESPWRALRIAGTLPFTLTGVIASLTRPLADASIPVFVISTFDTDYILINPASMPAAARALTAAGHAVSPPG